MSCLKMWGCEWAVCYLTELFKAEEERPDLKSTDNSSSTHNMIYAHQEPGSSSSTVNGQTEKKGGGKKAILTSQLMSDKNLWHSSQDPSQASLLSCLLRCQKNSWMPEKRRGKKKKKEKKQRWRKGREKKTSKTILPWHTKGISGLTENRLQMSAKTWGGNVYNLVHLVYPIDASSMTWYLAAFT